MAKSSGKSSGRPKSNPPKAGFTKAGRKYGCGGKMSTKKK